LTAAGGAIRRANAAVRAEYFYHGLFDPAPKKQSKKIIGMEGANEKETFTNSRYCLVRHRADVFQFMGAV